MIVYYIHEAVQKIELSQNVSPSGNRLLILSKKGEV